MEERCICCGESIPEGRQVCPKCEKGESDYNFKVGDEVITTEGVRGIMSDICTCSRCYNRGFFEPTWIDDSGDYNYITLFDKECGFHGYYKIGEYKFHNFDKNEVLREMTSHERELKKLRGQLKLIEEIEAKSDFIQKKE